MSTWCAYHTIHVAQSGVTSYVVSQNTGTLVIIPVYISDGCDGLTSLRKIRLKKLFSVVIRIIALEVGPNILTQDVWCPLS